MSEPTSALTIEDLILRVARETGMAYYGATGNERAMVPIDAHDLDLCKKIVLDGVRMFIASAPAKGWRWMRRIMSVTMTPTRITGTVDSSSSTTIVDLTLADTYDTDDDLNGYYAYILTGTGAGSWAVITDYTALTGTVTVADWLDAYGNAGGTDPAADDTFAITPVETVDGYIHRYPLPEYFGGTADGRITYASSSNQLANVEWCDEATIRSLRAVSSNTGYPLYAALRQLEPSAAGAGPKRRSEILFHPDPVAADTIEFPYSAYFDEVRLEAGKATSVDGTTGLLDSALDALYPDDFFNGWVIKIISGTGRNSYATVTDYDGATAKFVVADWLFSNGTVGGTDPATDSVYVVQPSANSHPAGMRFDEAIKSACLAEAEMTVDDLAGRGFLDKFIKKDLPEAKIIDQRSAARTLGTSNKNQGRRTRIWNDVSYD